MTTKYQRPAGAYAGANGLANRSKYGDDATATPKRAISSAKVDGDFNYVVDALNGIDEASGARGSIGERLDVSLNADGTLKFSTTGTLDEWIVQTSPGTLARVDDATLTMSGGDYQSIYSVNRRVRLTIGGNYFYGSVASAGYGGGLTTVAVTGLVNSSGAAAVIASAPTQVAYGPVTGGIKGNVPLRSESVVVSASGVDYMLTGDASDLVIKRGGSEVARVGSGGLSGLAAGSVAVATLAGAVTALLVPSGAVMPYAGASAPTGWLLCGGQAVSRTTYAGLFTVLGTAFGAGDGSTTFNVPDLRGRAVFGLDNLNGTAANRVTNAASGITGITLGAAGGSELMHQHSHTVSDSGHAHGVDTYAASTGTGAGIPQSAATPAGTDSVTKSATTGISINNAGTGSSQNMPPAMMMTYIIKV